MPSSGQIVTTVSVSAATAIVCFSIYKLLCTKYMNKLRKTVPPVYVCNNLSEWYNAERKFLRTLQRARFIGLDCEWITVEERRRPVALLQLATSESLCVLIRLCNIKTGIPKSLSELLANKKVLKVGVNVCDDAQKLLKDYGVIVQGCIDLRHLAKDLPECQKCKSLSLQSLVLNILKLDLKKSASLSCSNWEAETLSSQQIIYAAEDAIASALIFEELMRRSKEKFSLFSLIKSDYKFHNFIDVPYKHGKPNSSTHKNHKLKARVSSEKSAIPAYKKTIRRIKYENYLLEAPDGEALCTCDKRKADWYVERELAHVVSEDPYIVQLNFEPSGRPILDNIYYIQHKENCCVVCGFDQFLVRKFVVPSEYRKYFPGIMKKNLSHDVLLLCVDCHRKSNMFDFDLREQLAVECNAPIGNGFDVKTIFDNKVASVKSAARALFRSGDAIPEDRKNKLLKVICEFYPSTEITNELLKEASELNCVIPNSEYIPHGLKVYQHMCANGGLIAFEARWRQHFLDTMKPEFLPTMWSVDHNHERLALQVLTDKADFDASILGLTPELIIKAKALKNEIE